MLLYLALLIVSIFNGSVNAMQSEAENILLILPEIQVGLNSPRIGSIETIPDKNLIVALGFQVNQQNQQIVTTYIWQMPNQFQNNTPFLEIHPSLTRIEIFEPPDFITNIAISPNSQNIILQTQNEVEVLSLEDFSLQKSLPLSENSRSRIATWSQNGDLIAFLVNDEQPGSQLLVWDWINDKIYEKEFSFSPNKIVYLRDYWLFWNDGEYFATCTHTLEYCREYKPDNDTLSFIYPTKDGHKIISGQYLENNFYQIIMWEWINNNYESTIGPTVDFGLRLPNLMNNEGSYLATASDIFETSQWTHLSHIERSSGSSGIFTPDSLSFIALDYNLLSIFNVETGENQNSINIQDIFNLDDEQYIDESSGMIQLSSDGKWVIIKFISVIALVPTNEIVN